MKDVAALAGVSQKTVSNVVTRAVPVREETRTRVEAAMLKLDFVPNLNARGLRSGRSGTIALALPDLATAFSAELLHRIVDAAHERGLAVQIEETAATPERERELLARARSHLIDGLILNPIRLEDSVIRYADRLPPLVVIGEVEQHRADHVRVDSRLAAADVTRHLLSRGVLFPTMMLQTLVENAIKHGLEPRTGGGTVWIRARRGDDGTVAVTVADDGDGFNNKTNGTGIGLRNVRERLRLVYGGEAALAVVANFPAGVAATISVPAKFKPEADHV